MQHIINSIVSSQTKGTQETMNAVHHFLNYCATHPDAYICYHASDMILWIHSDASYLTKPNARSRFGGHHYLSDSKGRPNGPILALAKIIKHVMSSAAEVELAALFHNAKDAIPSKNTLEALGQPQPTAPI